MTKRTIPEASSDTRFLYQRLIKVEAGETITYDELSKEIGRNVRKARYLLASARRMALSNDRVVFGTIRGVGLRRMDNSGIVGSVESRTKRIRNQARKGLKELGCVDGELSRDDTVKHNVGVSVFSVLSEITKPKSIKRLEGKVEATQASLPLAKTLDAFKEK